MALVTVSGAPRTAGMQTASPSRQLLIVLDGLRPDYVTQEVMPHLYALGRRGVVFANHHSVFPTVTRVNVSSIVTGSYPERHGLLGNSVFFPKVEAARFLDAGNPADLRTIDAAEQGRLLTAPSLGEILQSAGRQLLAVGADNPGAALLLNHKISGGAVLHTEYAVPGALFEQVVGKLGPPPPLTYPNDARNRRAVDTFFEIGLPMIDPSISIIWLSDPDATAHSLGVGHPTTVEALRRVDGEIQRLQDGLASRGLLDKYDIWVASDHGFSTFTGAPDVQAVLKPFSGTLADGSPRVIAREGAVYVRDGNRQTQAEIVRGLQKTPGIGAIFTRAVTPGSMMGWADGTLSFSVPRWDHERSADILYSPEWTDQKNQYGFAGTSASNGTAGHGSTSPFEVHNTLIAAGPDVKRRTVVSTPSGNIDLAPTFLWLLGLKQPESMQGRILYEALARSSVSSPAVQHLTQTTSTSDGSYHETAFISTVNIGSAAYRYFDYASTSR